MIAEFLVAKALGIEKAENVAYWTAYDISYREMRIEIKATEYVHAWNRKKVSKIRTFSIAPSNNWYWGQKGERKLSRQNDLYVFCLNTNQEVQNPQPLNLDFWEFYIVPTSMVNEYAVKSNNPDQKKISLNVVKRMAGEAVRWDNLRKRIDEVIDQIKPSKGSISTEMKEGNMIETAIVINSNLNHLSGRSSNIPEDTILYSGDELELQ